MKTTFFILLAVTAILSSTLGITGTQVIRSDTAAKYVSLIDKIIFNCEQKRAFLTSKSDSIRKDAILSLMKADFIRKNRDLLIEDMMKDAVAPSPPTVQHFMNQRFFAIIRDGEPVIVTAYSQPDKVALPRANP